MDTFSLDLNAEATFELLLSLDGVSNLGSSEVEGTTVL